MKFRVSYMNKKLIQSGYSWRFSTKGSHKYEVLFQGEIVSKFATTSEVIDWLDKKAHQEVKK